MPASSPLPPHSWMEALRIYTSLCQHQLAPCPDSLNPVFSGCLAGFLPLLTRADHCPFCIDLEITKITMKVPGAA